MNAWGKKKTTQESEFQVPATLEDVKWSSEKGRGYFYLRAQVGPFRLFIEEHDLHGVTWCISTGAALTDANAMECRAEETDLERAKKKCFTALNFFCIMRDELKALETS